MPKNRPALSVLRYRKRLYDAKYREQNRDRIKARNAAYFQATYDPEAARIKRRERMPYHVEYCRQPAYKAKKHEYDMRHRYLKLFGPYWEVMQLVVKVQKEVRKQVPDKYERMKMRGNILRLMRNRAIRMGWVNRSCIYEEA